MDQANPDSQPPEQSDLKQPGTRLISKILSPAIGLWLRSQVESAQTLEFQVSGCDRQILRGNVPAIEVLANQIVYQGLHLGHAQLRASGIQINLGQVIKGKPLRLLEIVPVVGEVWLSQADLDASMSALLLRQAIADILQRVFEQIEAECLAELRKFVAQPTALQYPSVVLGHEQLTLITEVIMPNQQRWHLTLQTQLRILTPTCLQLTELQLQTAPLCHSAQEFNLYPLEIDLGSDVDLQLLIIDPTQITCQGQINVNPG
jgi:hypothetical protein